MYQITNILKLDSGGRFETFFMDHNKKIYNLILFKQYKLHHSVFFLGHFT